MEQSRNVYTPNPVLINIAYLNIFSSNFPTKFASLGMSVTKNQLNEAVLFFALKPFLIAFNSFEVLRVLFLISFNDS